LIVAHPRLASLSMALHQSLQALLDDPPWGTALHFDWPRHALLAALLQHLHKLPDGAPRNGLLADGRGLGACVQVTEDSRVPKRPWQEGRFPKMVSGRHL